MTIEADVLAILTGRKVFDGRQWRVFDAGGTELADAGGVLWRGVHGALLWNVNEPRGGTIYPLWRRRGRRTDGSPPT